LYRLLVERFAECREEEAFAALVYRHGTMVLNVCRRVLQNEADAEDACQATFLVLARRARAIRKKDSVGSWLHGAAYRAAQSSKFIMNFWEGQVESNTCVVEQQARAKRGP
jgi:hypothetical protein